MAIEGLSIENEARPNIVDPSDAAAVTIGLLKELGINGDFDKAYEDIRTKYQAYLQTPGISVRPFTDIPYEVLPTEKLTDYADARVYRELWVPGQSSGSYTKHQLALCSPVDFETRAAVYSPADPHEPLLHFLSLPFDDENDDHNAQGPRTQLQAIKEATAEFEAEHPHMTMQALGHRAIILITMEQRLKGESLPLEWGYMRDATLPRKTFDDDTIIGDVDTHEGRLRLYRSCGVGVASPNDGVGLLVRQKKKSFQS